MLSIWELLVVVANTIFELELHVDSNDVGWPCTNMSQVFVLYPGEVVLSTSASNPEHPVNGPRGVCTPNSDVDTFAI
jgi:hypothetical protein